MNRGAGCRPRHGVWALVAIASLAIVITPRLGDTQPAGKVWQIGFLGAESPSTNRHFLDAFRLGIRERGYVEGQNIVIEERWAEGRNERFHDLSAELIRLKVDVMVTISTVAAREAKSVTKTTPIVFVAADPVKNGLVSSLGRPGGNLTGLSLTLGEEFAGKWLELLMEAIPQLSRVAVLWNPNNPSNASFLKAVQASAQSLKTTLQLQGVTDPGQFEGAFRSMTDARAQAVIVFVDPLTVWYRARIVELATKSRLPAIYGFREFVDAGGLMAYGTNVAGACRRAAVYVDKILKGARPGDLPVEQATQFEFLINLRTAKALGVTIPRSMLVRADEVIQ